MTADSLLICFEQFIGYNTKSDVVHTIYSSTNNHILQAVGLHYVSHLYTFVSEYNI